MRRILFRNVKHRQPKLHVQTRCELGGEVGFTARRKIRDGSLGQTPDVSVPRVRLGGQHRQRRPQVPSEAFDPQSPRLGTGFEIGIVGEHRGDVVVAGDPEAVIQPIPIARVVLTQDGQQLIGVIGKLPRDQLRRFDLGGGLTDPFPLKHFVSAKSGIASGAFRYGHSIGANNSQAALRHGCRASPTNSGEFIVQVQFAYRHDT